MKSGYFGIGIYRTKTEPNIGTLWRSAFNFGADFIFTIDARYRWQTTDTLKTPKHIPLFHFEDWQDFMEHKPEECEIVCVEQDEKAEQLTNFVHPKSAVYILGAEDSGIPREYLKGNRKVQFNTPQSLNVAVAGSIIMYDRIFN